MCFKSYEHFHLLLTDRQTGQTDWHSDYIHVVHIIDEDIFTQIKVWAPRSFGTWGEWLFIFRELGSLGNYFQGFREQPHSFGDLGSFAKK